MLPMYKGIPFSKSTTLINGISASETQAIVADALVLPEPPNMFTFADDVNGLYETVSYTGINGNIITGLTRGVEGIARAWGADTTLYRTFTAADHEALIENIQSKATTEQGKRADITAGFLTAQYDGGAANTYTIINLPQGFDINVTPTFDARFTLFNHNEGTGLVILGERYAMQEHGVSIAARAITTFDIRRVFVDVAKKVAEITYGDEEIATTAEIEEGLNGIKRVVPKALKPVLEKFVTGATIGGEPVPKEGTTLVLPEISGGGMPSGGVMAWWGTMDTIPAGWALCDGDNGTPDLRDMWIVGAGGKYGLGATMGAETVAITELQLPSHRHSESLSGGVHSHVVKSDFTASSSSGQPTRAMWSYNTGTLTPLTTDSASISLSGNTGYVGSGQAHENRPPSKALYYIMKL